MNGFLNARRGSLLAGTFLMLGLAGCAEQLPAPIVSPEADRDGLSVNDGYTTGSISTHDVAVPSLTDVQRIRRQHVQKLTKKEQARENAIRDAAQEYGLQSGLAFAGKEIKERLNQRAASLSQVYDFNAVLIRDPSSSVMLLPPVISERDKTWEVSDDGQTLRTADATYTVESDVSFASNAPLWHSYLLRSYEAPQRPAEDILPENDREQAVWDRYVTDAYGKGVRQAIDTLQDDMRRLNHDYVGMWRYHWLLAENRISSQYISVNNMGVTGSDQRVNMNEMRYNISVHPHLNYDHPEAIKASISTETPAESGVTPPAAGGPVAAPGNGEPVNGSTDAQ